jgi:hypothetical protein
MEGEEIHRDVRRQISKQLDPELDQARFQDMHGFPRTQSHCGTLSGLLRHLCRPSIGDTVADGWFVNQN